MRFKRYISCLLALYYSANLYAVQTVYRADTEAPLTVFQNGISAQQPGGNSNLLSYLEGYSERQGNAGLITTFVSDIDFNLFDVPRFYLYTVRADAHFYDVNLSLRLCRDHPISYMAELECRDLLENQLLQSSNLFIVQNNIPTANIESATEFVLNPNTHHYEVGTYSVNPNYQALSTQSNPYAYPITAYDVAHLFEHLGLVLVEQQPNQRNLVNGGMPIGACPTTRRHASMKLSQSNFLKTDKNFGCKYTAFAFYPIIVVLF